MNALMAPPMQPQAPPMGAGVPQPAMQPPMQPPQGNSLVAAAPAPGGPQNPMQRQQPNLTPEQMEEAIDHNKIVGGMMADTLGKPDVTSRDVLTMLTDLMKQGVTTPQKAAQIAATLPTEEKQVRPWLMQYFLKNVEVGRVLHYQKHGV